MIRSTQTQPGPRTSELSGLTMPAVPGRTRLEQEVERLPDPSSRGFQGSTLRDPLQRDPAGADPGDRPPPGPPPGVSPAERQRQNLPPE